MLGRLLAPASGSDRSIRAIEPQIAIGARARQIDGSGLSSPISERQVRCRESIARTQPTCRSALRPGWRRSSFWSVVRRRSGCTRSPTRVRSAAPAAPAAERGSGCFAVGQADTVPPWSLLLLRPEQHLGGTLRNHGDLIIIRHYRLVAPKNRGLDARTPRLRSTRDASCSGRQVATRAADPLGGSRSNAQAARLANRYSTWCCCYAAPRTWAQACQEGGAA